MKSLIDNKDLVENETQEATDEVAQENNVNTFQGFTGGPGLPGYMGMNEVNPLYTQDLKTKLLSDAKVLMVGATGGAALDGLPTDPATLGTTDLRAMRAKLRGTFGQQTLEGKVRMMSETWDSLKPTFMSAQSQMAMAALIMGDLGISLKSQVVDEKGHGAWLDTAKTYVTFMSIRTLQSYMAVAGIRGVENHLHHGIHRLVQFAAMIDEALVIEDDPIQKILDTTGPLPFDVSLQDVKIQGDAAILVYRLRRKNIIVDKAVARNFVAAGYELTPKDITEMEHRKEKGTDPGEFISLILNYHGSRDGLWTHTPKSKSKGKPAGSTTETPSPSETETQVSIPDVNSELVKFREDIEAILAMESLEHPIAPELIDELIEKLEALKVKQAEV